jgi:integrase
MYEREQWRTSRSPKTLDGNFRALAYYFGEHTDLSELTRQRIMDYVEWLRKTNPAISPSTVNQRLSMVSVLLETAAYTWGFPIDPFKMPRAKPRPGRTRIVRQDEEERILGALGDDEPMVALVECLIDTGCRLSEMLNLDVRRDVLWDFGFIIVHQSKTDVPKQVPMTSRVRARLAGTKEGLRNPFGGLTVYEADRRFRKVREALGLQDDKELVLHSLRHTAASRLAAAGIDAFRIQKFMGHRNVTTTQRYVTLYGTDIQDLTRVFEKVP